MTTLRHGYATGKMAPIYRVWASMRSRCNCQTDSGYAAYGAKGIKVCERWNVFENFLADMGQRPSPKHSLDRFPNQSGDYEPSNCRWATVKEQNLNRSNTIRISHDGETHTADVWAARFGIRRATIYDRYRNGKRGGDLFTPAYPRTRTTEA